VVHDGFSSHGVNAGPPPQELQVVHEQQRQEMAGQGQHFLENYERRPELGGSAVHFPGNHELSG
jgi:hypothetical protein